MRPILFEVLDVPLVIVILIVGAPLVLSRLLRMRTDTSVEIGLVFTLCIFLAIAWVIYFAGDDIQGVVIEAWGWFSGLVKLVAGFLVLRHARAKIMSGEGRVWHYPVEWLGYLLMILGLLGLLSELIVTLFIGE